MLGAELWVIGDKAGTDGRLELVEVPPAENTTSKQLITQIHTRQTKQGCIKLKQARYYNVYTCLKAETKELCDFKKS